MSCLTELLLDVCGALVTAEDFRLPVSAIFGNTRATYDGTHVHFDTMEPAIEGIGILTILRDSAGRVAELHIAEIPNFQPRTLYATILGGGGRGRSFSKRESDSPSRID
jgi:hypothetical protein